MTTRFSFALIAATAILSAPAGAQLLPPLGGGSGGGLGGVVGGVVGGVNRTVDSIGGPVMSGPVGGILSSPGSVLGSNRLGTTANSVSVQEQALTEGGFDRVESLVSSVAAPPASLMELRRMRLQMLIRAHRRELDRDEDGNPVRRDRLVAVQPVPATLAAAARAGFHVIDNQADPILGVRVVTLSIPKRMSPRKALARLRKAAMGIDADYDHVFEPAGGALAPSDIALAMGAAGSKTWS